MARSTGRIDIAVEDVHSVFRQWHSDLTPPVSVARLSIYREAYQHEKDERLATQAVFSQVLAELEREDPGSAQILRLRFISRETFSTLSTQLSIAESTLWQKQREALESFTDTLIKKERQLRGARLHELQKRLGPPPYLNLIGHENTLRLLQTKVVDKGPPWIFALTGIGGIGKTTIADALARQLYVRGYFDDVAWISTLDRPALTATGLVERLFKQLIPNFDSSSVLPPIEEMYQALRIHLQGRRQLIVIDGLETVIEPTELLPVLHSLARPSRFLVTTRLNLFTALDFWYYSIPPLDKADALRFLRQEARQRNLPHVIEAEEESLIPLYDLVGGNPLALRLILGRLYTHSLEEVLDDVSKGQGDKVGYLFDPIYRVVWERLDERARTVLFAIASISDENGASSKLLQKVTKLERPDLSHALEILATHNLINIQGSVLERSYGVHQLTRLFLQAQLREGFD